MRTFDTQQIHETHVPPILRIAQTPRSSKCSYIFVASATSVLRSLLASSHKTAEASRDISPSGDAVTCHCAELALEI